MATVTVFSGEYDVGCRGELRQDLDRLVFEATTILDFTNVRFIDATCLAELLRLHHLRQANGVKPMTFVLKHDNAIYRLFDACNLLDVFRVVETIDEALAKNGADVRVRYG